METPMEIPGKVTPEESARTTFKKELRHVLRVSQEADTFVHLLNEYVRTINIALADSPNHEIVAYSWDVVRMQGLKNSSQDQTSTNAEDLAIQKSAKSIFVWFNERFGGMTSTLSSYIGEDIDKQEALQQTIGKNLAKCITIRTGLGKVFKQELQKRSIDEMAQFLLDNSDSFKNLKKDRDLQENLQSEGLLVDKVEEFLASKEAEEAVLELSHDVRIFELRDWIANTSGDARRGKKIYETPYYENLLDELHFQSRKRNGVGGVILYGPPGTGKTEIVQEKNRQQGFRTRVINIHHYSSFADLIGDKAIQLGIDRGVSISQKLKIVIDTFASEPPEVFGKDIQDLFTQLKQEGKLSEQTDIGSFLKSFVSQDLDLSDPSSFEWGRIRDDFVQRQRSRILRASLGEPYQESVQDIVKGEIFLAIENGQRVVLDELDKAGPNSLGGILSFLAKSPGETFEYGQMKINIPPWFIVDATSNSAQLNEYLKDRFSDLEVSTPPIKDQLMIAAVRLADNEGNILLTDYEQRQLVGFFAYMVPNINRILADNDILPMSNRRIQELTSYLVDFSSMQRTDISFGSAVSKLFHHNSGWTRNKKAAQELNKLFKYYKGVLQDEPRNFREQRASDASVSVADTSSRLSGKRAIYVHALKQIASSPLLVAIDGLSGHEAKQVGKPSLSQIKLNEKQKKIVEGWLIDESSNKRSSMQVKKLSLGFDIQEELGGVEEDAVLRITATPANINERIQTMLSDKIPTKGEIVTASDDGSVVIVRNKDSATLDNILIFETGLNKDSKPMRIDAGKEAIIHADMKVKYVGILNNDHSLNFYDGSSLDELANFDSVKRFQIASNGRFALIEHMNGETELIQIESGDQLVLLPGSNWTIVGNSLIVQENKSKIVEDRVFLIR